MITTQRTRIPWSWVLLITLPGAFYFYVEQMTATTMTMTMAKFTKSPALITFLASFNVAFTFLAAPFVAWKSDRIWTRFGRRKPFLIFGWIGLGVSLVFMPLAPNIWLLGLAIMAVQFCADITFQGTFHPLMWEIVPAPQRGRAAASWNWIGMALQLYASFCLIGRFDDVYNLRLNLGVLGHPDVVVRGEELIYWGTGAVFLILAAHLLFNVKEMPVKSTLVGERFHWGAFVKGIFGERQWLMLYLLIFSQIAMNVGLGNLNTMLMTEQFHYSKSAFGNIMGWSMVLKLALVIPMVGFLSDRFDRLSLYRWGLLFSTIHPIGYWIFIKFMAANQVPTREWIIGFDVFGASVDVVGNLALTPLFMDFVPRNLMGTVTCGMAFARGAVRMLIMNGVGITSSVYASMFLAKGTYDYSVGLLYMFVIGIFGCIAAAYFARQVRDGKVVKYGLQDETITETVDSTQMLVSVD